MLSYINDFLLAKGKSYLVISHVGVLTSGAKEGRGVYLFPYYKGLNIRIETVMSSFYSSHSDGEPTSASTEPYDPTAIAELHRMVARQQEEIKELKVLQCQNFVSFQQQLNIISTPILEELKAMALDQRILLYWWGAIGTFML